MNSSSYTLYDNSLGIALVLMLFFALYFLVAKTPDKHIFGNYLKSRRLMAGALLALSANYSVHLFVAPRFLWKEAAIMLNLSGVLSLNENQTNQQTGKPRIGTTTAIRMLLDKASTVKEAIQLLSNYDMDMRGSGRGNYHYFNRLTHNA